MITCSVDAFYSQFVSTRLLLTTSVLRCGTTFFHSFSHIVFVTVRFSLLRVPTGQNRQTSEDDEYSEN